MDHTTKQLLIFQLDCLFNNLGGLCPPRWLNKTVSLNRSITITYRSRMLGGVHLRMENFQESWLKSQQAGVSGLCEKFHLYRLEKLVAISKFLDSYCSRIMGGGQDNPAGLSSPPGGKINQPGYVAPRG